MIHIQFLSLTFNSEKGTSIKLLRYLEIMFILSSIFYLKLHHLKHLNINYYDMISFVNIVYIV